MNDWSKDINLETIKEYLQECAENDDYHYEQYQVDIVMHEYIRQKQIIEGLKKEIERLNNIINEALGIANERFNYYSNHKNNNEEHLEDWGNIFNILLRRDN